MILWYKIVFGPVTIVSYFVFFLWLYRNKKSNITYKILSFFCFSTSLYSLSVWLFYISPNEEFARCALYINSIFGPLVPFLWYLFLTNMVKDYVYETDTVSIVYGIIDALFIIFFLYHAANYKILNRGDWFFPEPSELLFPFGVFYSLLIAHGVFIIFHSLSLSPKIHILYIWSLIGFTIIYGALGLIDTMIITEQIMIIPRIPYSSIAGLTYIIFHIFILNKLLELNIKKKEIGTYAEKLTINSSNMENIKEIISDILKNYFYASNVKINIPPTNSNLKKIELDIPLMLGATQVGNIEIEKRRRGKYSKFEKKFINNFALLASFAIENSRLINQQSDMVYNIAHDLRTPLTPITVLAEYLEKKVSSHSKESQAIQTILIETRRFSALIDMLQIIAELDKKISMPIHKKKFNVETIIDESCNLFSPLFEQNDISVIKHNFSELPMIMGDENLLKQVIINLLSNCSKYTRKNGSIDIHIYNESDSIKIDITNTCLFVDESELPHMFEKRFFRTKKAEESKHSGMGVGLSICKYIIDLHDGKIQAKTNEVKDKLTVTVMLPIKNKEEQNEKNSYS